MDGQISDFASRLALKLPRLMRREQWTLGVVRQSAQDLAVNGLTAPVQWLPPRPDGFVADPCVAKRPDGTYQLFAEVLDYRDGKGRLEQAVLSSGGLNDLAFQAAVDIPAHVSYPHPLLWQGEWLLFCECWEAHGLVVFSAPVLSGPWVLRHRLLPGMQIVDPTPVAHQGRWYLFYTLRNDGPSARLRLMYAETPLGPWQPHQQDVVVEGLGGARPAGPLFRLDDGTLIRSGQDCRQTYGGGLNLFRVDCMTPQCYAETPLRDIAPPAGPWRWGLHTLCPVDNSCCMVDGKRWQPAPLDPLRALRRLPRVKQRRHLAMQLVP